jgi:ankyrin repeat protein
LKKMTDNGTNEVRFLELGNGTREMCIVHLHGRTRSKFKLLDERKPHTFRIVTIDHSDIRSLKNHPLPAQMISTPLHSYAFTGDSKAATALLEDEAVSGNVDVNARDAYGDTPLLVAAKRGKKSILSLLLRQNQTLVNASNDRGENALHRAALCMGCSIEIVSMLLEAGVDPHLRNFDGKQPAKVAVQQGRDELARMMVRASTLGATRRKISRMAFREHSGKR